MNVTRDRVVEGYNLDVLSVAPPALHIAPVMIHRVTEASETTDSLIDLAEVHDMSDSESRGTSAVQSPYDYIARRLFGCEKVAFSRNCWHGFAWYSSQEASG